MFTFSPELLFKVGYAPRLSVARRLFLSQQKSEFFKLRFERGLHAFSILEPCVEFAFAQGEDMRADLEITFGLRGRAGVAGGFLLSAASAFLERLHPEGLGDVRHGLRQAVQRGGPRIYA